MRRARAFVTQAVLVLNASYEPLDILSAKHAVGMILDDEVEMVEHSGRYFRSPSIAIPVPSVVRLKQYVDTPPHLRSVMLTTRAVLTRDGYRCAYRGQPRGPKDGRCKGNATTMDHVVPRARGGTHRWENVVAACGACNALKADSTLEELGWVSEIEPQRPAGIVAQLLRMTPDPLWAPWLRIAG